MHMRCETFYGNWILMHVVSQLFVKQWVTTFVTLLILLLAHPVSGRYAERSCVMQDELIRVQHVCCAPSPFSATHNVQSKHAVMLS